MNLLAFCVYDQKAKAHIVPFFLPTEPMAVRTFTDCVNSSSHQWGKHPEDYTLMMIGQFDADKGILLPNDKPLLIGSGTSFLNPDLPGESEIAQLQPE